MVCRVVGLGSDEEMNKPVPSNSRSYLYIQNLSLYRHRGLQIGLMRVRIKSGSEAHHQALAKHSLTRLTITPHHTASYPVSNEDDNDLEDH
jgi:hypothetical protein